MKVANPHGLPLVDYRTVKPLQGNLKDLSDRNHDKLLRVLQKRGFTTPLFVWQNPADAVLYLMDGHQRLRVMTKNNLTADDGSYNVPYLRIAADSLQEAKEQLLEITSQYGTITQDGLDEFGADLNLDGLDINFDALRFDPITGDDPDQNDPPNSERASITCPDCGSVFVPGEAAA